MTSKTIPYLLLSIAVVVFIGIAFYLVAGVDVLPFESQDLSQSVLPKPVSAKEVMPPFMAPESEDTLPADSAEEAESIESGESSTEQDEEQQKVSETPPGATEKPKLQPAVHFVSIGANVFIPNLITIKVGDTVRWANNDTQLHWPASDPHPTHTGVYDFDPLADLLPGEAFSYTFTQEGAFGYHDHTQAVIKDKATITGVVRVLPRE